MAKIRVQQYGSNKTFWIETDPVLATRAVLGKNLFFQDPNSGDHVLLQQQDVLNAGTVQALAGNNLVQADNPGSKIASTTATSSGGGRGGLGAGSGTTLTGDTTATITGPGTFTVTVTGIKGHVISAAPSANGQILIYNTAASGTWAPIALSGDATMTNGGVVNVGKINGATLGVTTAGSVGNILLVNGLFAWTSTTMSGDVTINATGVTAIGANKVTNAQLAQAAALTLKGNSSGIPANVADITMAAVKTALGLTGTNSGDVTLTAVGATPNSNGASLSGQALTLQPADPSNPGVLSTTLYAAFNKNVGLLNSANITVPVGNTIANTITTTKFTSQPTLPASVAAGTVIKISAAGVYSTTGSPTFNFQMLLGATQLAGTGFVTAPTTVTNQRFVFELTLIVIDNTHVEASGTLRIQNAATTEQVYNFAPTATIAVTSVNSGVLALQFSWGTASVSNTITLRQMICEVMAP